MRPSWRERTRETRSWWPDGEKIRDPSSEPNYEKAFPTRLGIRNRYSRVNRKIGHFLDTLLPASNLKEQVPVGTRMRPERGGMAKEEKKEPVYCGDGYNWWSSWGFGIIHRIVFGEICQCQKLATEIPTDRQTNQPMDRSTNHWTDTLCIDASKNVALNLFYLV